MRILLGILCLFSGFVRGGEFHVCTVASYRHENLEKLLTSCQRHNIDLDIIGLDLPYFGNGTKLLRLDEYLATIPDEDIVMFVDAFDVLIVEDKEVILKKFLKFDTPFVMSAEKNCVPFSELAPHFSNAPGSFKYINTGGFIGYARNLKDWLDSLRPFQLSECDQGQVTKNYLKNRDVFKIDHECILFFSLTRVTRREIAIDGKGVRCVPTGSRPSVVHANGKNFRFWNIVYEKLIEKGVAE